MKNYINNVLSLKSYRHTSGSCALTIVVYKVYFEKTTQSK